MILHIPHSSTLLQGLEDYNDFIPAMNYLTDFYTDELFHHWNSEAVIYPFSRLWCDVERLENDPMEDIGQGIIYSKFNNEIIRTISEKNIKLVMQDYKKHHSKLNKAVNSGLSLFPTVSVVDCHSFYPNEGAPDVCIGTNNKKPEYLQELIVYFENKGLDVRLNFPFKGSIIPNVKGSIDTIMIEVNKKLYLTKSSNYTLKSEDFNRTCSIITGALDIISNYELKMDI